MRETTASFTRVAILTLAICLFASAWSHDQQAQSAYILARRGASRQSAPAAVVSRTAPVCRQRTTPIAAPTPTISRVIVEMPLPEDIAPGRYHVIDVFGRVYTIVVSGVTAAASSKPSDLYLLDLADGNRQYFIRIGSDEPAADVNRTASSEIRDALRE